MAGIELLEQSLATEPGEMFSESVAGSWFVLWTKSRQEKVVSSDLSARGVFNFLPLSTQIRYYGPQKVSIEVPLFPGYVFLRGSAEDAYALDRAGRIARILTIADQKTVNWELKNLHFALLHDTPLQTFRHLRVGVRVEVRAGPLRGLQGIIESHARRDRLILQVKTLGRALSMEVDGAMLDVVG